MSTNLSVGDKVTLVGLGHSRGVVTEVHGAKDTGRGNAGITVKWANGNVVDISHLCAKEIVRKL